MKLENKMLLLTRLKNGIKYFRTRKQTDWKHVDHVYLNEFLAILEDYLSGETLEERALEVFNGKEM